MRAQLTKETSGQETSGQGTGRQETGGQETGGHETAGEEIGGTGHTGEIVDPWDDPDVVVVYTPKFDEYGLPVRDGGTSMVVIGYCPWCGARLPESRRDAWFDAVEGLGLDPWEDELPEEYHTDAWWNADPAPGQQRDHVEPERVVTPT